MQPRRKDMVNLPKVIDEYATNDLSKGMMAHLEDIPREIKDLIDTRIKDNPLALQRLDSIIAGSVRGEARLHKARRTTSSECKLW